MAFKRTYTLQEVHDLICESEGRDSPTTGASGHSVNLHADMRENISHRNTQTIILAATIDQTRAMNPAQGIITNVNKKPGKDSRFTSRGDMVKAVYQAINSGAGQGELQRFDVDSALNRVTCEIALTKPIKRIERHTKSTGTVERDLVAYSVFLVIDRMGSGIHLQTAFPGDVRTA